MDNLDLYLKNLTGKDELKAMEAASFLIDNSSVELYKKLVERTDYLFDFVRNNVCKRIEKAVNSHNFLNIINLFNIYSSYYDDLFASILSKHANEDLTDKIFELLEKGTIDQKTYAAKYFTYIPDTVALEILTKYAFDDDEYLSYNSAEALGQMQDDVTYDIALNYLKSDDDFEKLKAVRYFNAYGRNYPISEIFAAMNNSKMPENIAGQIPYMQSLIELFNIPGMKYDVLTALDYILSGLGEILPLADVYQFELYELLELLIDINKSDNEYSGKISEVLIRAYFKFTLFTENQEYIFDEDNNTKDEIKAIFNLLKSKDKQFWDKQKVYIIQELTGGDDERIISSLPLIAEANITDAVKNIRDILAENSNEIVLCEALTALKVLGCIEKSDIENVMIKIHNPNIKAIIDSLKA